MASIARCPEGRLSGMKPHSCDLWLGMSNSPDTIEAAGLRTREGNLMAAVARVREWRSLSIVFERGVLRTPTTFDGIFAGRSATVFGLSAWTPGVIDTWLGRGKPTIIRRLGGLAGSKMRAGSLVVSACPALLETMGRLARVTTLLDVVDFPLCDSNRGASAREQWKRRMSWLRGRVSGATTNSEAALEYLLERGWAARLVRNGIDRGRFPDNRGTKPGRFDVGFVSVFSQWTDFSFLHRLFGQMPGVTFAAHGIVRCDVQDEFNRLLAHRNFTWLGESHPSEVPGFLATCAVTIVPYRVPSGPSPLGDSMKVLESIAAGIPPVILRFQGGLAQRYEGLAYVCDSAKEAVDVIRRLLLSGPSEGWGEEARSFSRKNSWETRAGEILAFADELASGRGREEENRV